MRTVNELNENELEELRDSYFDQLESEGEETQLNFAHEIPMNNVKAHYEDVMFSEDDFWCNL